MLLSTVEETFTGMKCRATFDEYLGNPIGSYTVGPMHMLWCHSAWLSGLTLWGRLEREHTTRLMLSRCRIIALWQSLCLIDLRRVEAMDSTVLDSLFASLRARSQTRSASVSGLALLRPERLVGITLADLCRAHDAPCRIEVFTDPYSALAWLGAGYASDTISELDDVLCRIAGNDSALSVLRAYLDQNPHKISLTTASAALGMSRRALQRKLKEAHTSFRAEQTAAQIQRAKHLLRDTNHEIKRIAFEVGCSSLAAFSTLFRRIEGEAPSTWRSQIVPGDSPYLRGLSLPRRHTVTEAESRNQRDAPSAKK